MMLAFLKRWWVLFTVGALILLLVGDFYEVRASHDGYKWVSREMFLDIAPNLMADLITILIGYAIFRFTARDHYVATMTAVRTAVQKVPAELQLAPRQVQALMEGLVPIVSYLYFKDSLPTSKKAKQDKVYTTNCRSCTQPCIVKNGRCNVKCYDIPESWGQELSEVTQPITNAAGSNELPGKQPA